MSQTLIVPPAVEPVTLDDLRFFLRLDGTAEDGLVASLAAAARAHLEALTGRIFITQGWRIRRDAWPAEGRMMLPLGPVDSLDAVTVTGADGDAAVPTERFRLDGTALPPRMGWRPGTVPAPAVPLAGIAIDVTVGFGGPQDVPSPLLQAVRLLTAHWFENRSLVTVGHEMAIMPRMVADMIAPFVVRRVA